MRPLHATAAALSLGLAADAEGAAPPRALLLGNSYTQFNELDQRVQELARGSGPPLTGLTGERLADGGLTLNDHLSRTRSTADSNAWWTRFGAGTVPAAVVVMQDQSQVPGFPEDHPFWIASASAVGPLADLAATAGATTFLFVTWGRRDGDSGNPTLYPDFSTMNNRLEAGYRRYAELAATPERPIFLVPVNRAFAAVHAELVAEGLDPLADDSAFVALYDGDGSHPSRLGSALIAAVMVPATTGWSPRWLSPPPGLDRDEVEPFIDVVEGVVVPDGDLSYPWAGPWGSDVADGAPTAAGRLISHPLYLWTEVLPPGETSVDDVVLGGAHEDGDGWSGGGGRLWAPAGATLTAGTVRLGQEEGGAGELVINGGVAVVEEVVSFAACGRVRVRAGELHLNRLVVEDSDLDGVFVDSLEIIDGLLSVNEAPALLMRGGTLRSGGAPAAIERLDVRAGAVQADPGGPTARVGLLVAEGTLTVRTSDDGPCAPSLPPQVVVEASSCAVTGLSLTAHTGCVAALEDTAGGGCAITLRGDGPSDPDSGDGGEPTPGDTAEVVDDAPLGDSGSDGLSIVKTPDGGCGCAGGAASGGVAGLAAAVIAALRRRRSGR